MTITQITKADADKAKHDRLARLKVEYAQLTLEVIVLVDSWTLEEVEEVAKRRREINERIKEIEECLAK